MYPQKKVVTIKEFEGDFMKLQTLKGFRDFLPAEALKRKWLNNKLSEIFELWGYDPLETPTLEPLELFAGQIGEEEKLFYKFKDNGGRDVALRYDQTVPTCRVVGEYSNTLPLPFKRYQIQSAYRAENPQKGRYREFLQADADIFGVENPLSDAEVIALSLDIYRRLGFKEAKVLISDRALLKDIPYAAIVAIDKLKKISEDGVIAEMIKKGIANDEAKKYLQYVKDLKPNETIVTILNYLKSAGFPESWYEFDPTIARSFAYSTGPIWEVIIPGYNGGSVLGGERYDKLVADVAGVNIPGTGFGLGFDRTLEAAIQFNLIPDTKTKTQILVTIFSPDLALNAVTLAGKLRDSGINVDIFPDANAKLDKQLKYADKKGIPYVIIQGTEEVKKNVITLKNMSEKTQTELPLSSVIDKLRSS